MRCAISLTRDSLNVRAMSACLSQHLTLSAVPLPAFPPAGQSAVPPSVLIQPSVGIRTPFAPRSRSSSPPSSHSALRPPTESLSLVIPPTLSYGSGSYIRPPGPPPLSYPLGSYAPPPGPPTTYPPPSGIQPSAPMFQGPQHIIIMPPPPTVVSGPTHGQPHTFIPGASTSQLAPRPRSRSRTSDVVVGVPPPASRRTPTVLVPDSPHGRYPSHRQRTHDEPGPRSRSPSPVIHMPPASRRTRSRSQSRPRRGRSESPIIFTRSRPRSPSTSSRQRGRTQPSVYPPPIVPPGTAEPMVLQMPRSRSWSESPRRDTYDDRTREPGRRTRSRDRHRHRLAKPRPRSRGRDPIILAPPLPGVSGQAPASQAPFFVPPTAPPVPVVVEQPFSAAPISPPRSRPRSREHAPMVVLPPSDPHERHRDRDRYRRHDDRYGDRYGRRRRSMDYPYRRHSPSRYRPSRPRSRSHSPQYRRDRHHRGRHPSYSPSYSGYDSRSGSPSPDRYPSYSGRPRSSSGYPRSSHRPPSRYITGDYDSSSPPLVTFGPEPRPHSLSGSPSIVIPSRSRAPPESRRPTLVTRSRGRSRSRSPLTIIEEPPRERPPTVFHEDTQQPTTYAPSVHVPSVSQSALRRHLN